MRNCNRKSVRFILKLPDYHFRPSASIIHIDFFRKNIQNVLNFRLQHYITAALLPLDDLKLHMDRLKNASDNVDLFQTEMNSYITTFNDEWEMVHDLKSAHQKSYMEYVSNLYRHRVEEAENDNIPGWSVAEKIREAFMSLDQDMSTEAITHAGEDEVGLMTSTVALSGAVAVVAHIDGPMLHIASSGDCVAVLGSLSENDTWIAKKLTVDHNTDNQAEIKRILDEHPGEQKRNIFRGDRLLGISLLFFYVVSCSLSDFRHVGTTTSFWRFSI